MGISDFSCNVEFNYLPADVVGVESNIVGAKFDKNAWTILAAVDSVNHRFSATVTSFSDFTGGDPRPLAVTLSDFQAVAFKSFALLQWTTALEVDTVGFNVYRSTSLDGERLQLNAALIPPQGIGGVGGAAYTFVDTSPQPGAVYYYWLEAVSVSASEFFGPATVQTHFVTFLPQVQH